MDRLTYRPEPKIKPINYLISTGIVTAALFFAGCNNADNRSSTQDPRLFVVQKTFCGGENAGEGYVTHDKSGFVFHDTNIEQGEPAVISGIKSRAEAIGYCTTGGLRE